MKNKINIAVEYNANIVKFLEKDFNIITDPYVVYKNGDIVKNFDYYLYFNENSGISGISDKYLYSYISHNKDITIGCPRYDKICQTYIFNRLNINTPRIYFNGKDDVESMEVLLSSDFSDNEEIIIKPSMGARGIGQYKIKIGAFYDLLLKGYNNDSLKQASDSEPASLDKEDLDHKDYGVHAIKDGDFIISEYVKPISEYRWIQFFDEEPMIIKRNIDKGWQANASVSGLGNLVLDNKTIPNFDKINNDIGMLMIDTNAAFMGFDIYETNNGYGFFEFQCEMGHQAFQPHAKEFISRINKGLMNKINSFNN